MPDDDLVVQEFHSIHVTRERDMGVLEGGFAKGWRFISMRTGCGGTVEEAKADLERGGSIQGWLLR